MPSNHLILCCPLLLPSIFPRIRVFSNDSAFLIRWQKYWSYSFSVSPSNEYSGLISFRIDWFDLLAIQGTFKSLSNTTVQKHQFFSVQRARAHTSPFFRSESKTFLCFWTKLSIILLAWTTLGRRTLLGLVSNFVDQFLVYGLSGSPTRTWVPVTMSLLLISVPHTIPAPYGHSVNMRIKIKLMRECMSTLWL